MAENETEKKNWFMRHKIASVILAIVALWILGTVAGDTKSTTVTPAKKKTEQASEQKKFEPKVYQGTGDDVVTIEKPDGMSIVSFDCVECTGNTAVKTNGAEALLVNTIGPYTGSHLVDASKGSNTSQVTITASGAWKLTVSGLDKATAMQQSTTGQGDSVLHLTQKSTKAALTNTGDSNFAVKVYPEKGGFPDLAVNTIGSYKGTVPMKSPAFVEITSNGSWTISTQ